MLRFLTDELQEAEDVGDRGRSFRSQSTAHDARILQCGFWDMFSPDGTGIVLCWIRQTFVCLNILPVMNMT
jgi:hypothetical protein